MDYHYPQGIGTATRRAASRTLWLDAVSSEVRLQVGGDRLVAQYTRDPRAYRARFMRNGEVGGVQVTGLERVLDEKSLSLQTAHVLISGKKTPAFTGHCRLLQTPKSLQ